MAGAPISRLGRNSRRRDCRVNGAGARDLSRRCFPEGNLAKPGERFRYRTGVFYVYRDFDLPVAPVATNLGLFWPHADFKKNPGRATVEFLDPIPPGLGRGELLTCLETTIETRTQELIAAATGEPVRPSVLVPTPDDWPGRRRRRRHRAALATNSGAMHHLG
jgi:1-acyl-sn-glycerol-3-phosphate acyltransferase